MPLAKRICIVDFVIETLSDSGSIPDRSTMNSDTTKIQDCKLPFIEVECERIAVDLLLLRTVDSNGDVRSFFLSV